MPSPVPTKGDLINIDLDGNGDKTYRVLSINGDVAEVVAMYDISPLCVFNTTDKTTIMGNITVQQYSDSDLDIYLNTTWYNTLNAIAKAAIVPKPIIQDAWYWSNSVVSGNPIYSGTYGESVPGTRGEYSIGKYADAEINVGIRNIYSLGVQDVVSYLNNSIVQVDTTAILRNVNIWKMFWNTEAQPSSYPYLWLRSAIANNSNRVWVVRGRLGLLDNNTINSTSGLGGSAARPAFQINLSKIPFTKTTEVISK